MGNLNYGEYDEETAQQEKEEADAAGGAEFMKLKVGRNIVRILPPPKGQSRPFRVVYQHFIEMPGMRKSVSCARLEARKPCGVCSKVEELRKSKLEADQKMANGLFARRRVFVNVIDRSDPEKGPKVLAVGKKIHEQLLALRSDAEAGANYTHPLTGNDIVIERTGTGMTDTSYKVMLGKVKPLGPSDMTMQQWIDEQHNLDKYARLPTVEEVAQLLSGEAPTETSAPAGRGNGGGYSNARAGGKPARSAEDDAIDVEAEDDADA